MVATPRLTLPQFLALPETKPASEYIDGEVTQKAMPTYWHMYIQSLLVLVFNAYLRTHPGGAAGPELRCIIERPGTRWAPVPDFVYVADARRRGLRGNRPFHGAPDLAVEILSPDDRADRVAAKLQRYLRNGVRAVWLINPVARTITVMTSPSAARILADDEMLEGGEVLPDFAVPVRDLLPPAGEPADEDEDDMHDQPTN